MRKHTRILFFSLLSVAPLMLLLTQNYGRALVLTGLLIAGMIVFEKREASRQFFRALRKLLVCVDFEAFCKEGDKIRRNAMLPRLAMHHHHLYKIIAQYHKGDTVIEKLDFLPVEKSLQFWAMSYTMLWNAQRFDDSSLLALKHLMRKLPIYMKSLAAERYAVFSLDLIDPDDASQFESANRIRADLSAQLLLAEGTLWLSQHISDAKRIRSYTKTAENLSKGLFIRRY